MQVNQTRNLINLNEPLAFLIVITPIIGVSIASTYYINKLIQDRKDRKPAFGKFQRKKENEIWFIYVGSPSKPIRNCNATFKGKPLLIRGTTNYKKGVDFGEGCNFDMPSSVSKDDDDFIIIRDGKKKIEKEKFNKLEFS
ncbi:MAG: hypothetical protein HY222_05765 [Thaumarchaeota archaeon]|nr:hypothetical protein [Nitrososphaerota archaeon]MBI3641883.1 hypothetical protein [Nitrososphaerota archaeon]